MPAMWAPKVERADSFNQDVRELETTYHDIESIVAELVEFLTLAWNPPHAAVDPKALPSFYTTQLDYPLLGPDGLRKFVVVYHASAQSANPMQEPLRRYTLLSLLEQ